MPSVGVAFYLEPHNPLRSSAWVSIDGGALQLKEHPAADKAVIWITNVELSAFIEWDITQPNFKRNDFIPGGLQNFILDMGSTVTALNKKGEGVVYASEMLARAIRILHQYGLCSDISSLTKLGDAARRHVPIAQEQEQVEQAHSAMCIGAYKAEYSNTSLEALRDAQRVSVRFPHGVYAKHIANRPVPSGGFTSLPVNREAPALQVITELLTSATGFVKLKTTKGRLKRLEHIAFTEQAGQWFAFPDAFEIAKQIEVKIVEVYVSEGQSYPIRPLVELICQGQRIPLLTATLGLLLHSTWVQMASQRLMRSDNSHAFPSSQAAYLRSWDRMSCFKAARHLAKEGAIIIGYGQGAIQMAVPKRETEKFLILAYECGMTSSLSMFGREKAMEKIFTKSKAHA